MRILNKQWGRIFREETPPGAPGDPGAPATPPAAPPGDKPVEITMDSLLASVDEGLRGEFAQTMKDVKDVPGLLKTAVNAQRMIGNSVRVPGEDASPEQWDQFYAKLEGVKGVAVTKDEAALRKTLGVPEKPDGYKVDLSDLPEEIQISQAELDAKREYWQKLGLTQKQVETEVQRWKDEEVQGFNQWKEQNQAAERAIREKYGAAYDEKMELVRYVTGNVLPAEDVEYLKASGALLRPGVLDMLVTLGEQLKDNGTIEAARQRTQVYAPQEAQEKLAEIRGNPAYMDAKHPEHKSLVEKAQRLYQMAYPEQ